ncbi:NADP-dependent oxidoreductase [Thalassospira xiamenensis]|uniref:NADP-dependent oxidoreductase n=1 Tax=Thalassospira xiamenensis TaxID=220697 RepID=UPI000E06A076|nr:NADP-dependent oxidoreductase [Thalassospira xiamenensis]RCK31953.1 NADP-dependent oxidoreductase [Thalassospira xiamenensis]
MSIAAKEVHLLHYPDGVPTRDDFTVRDSVLPRPAIGEVLIENIWMSVDPYMRGRMTRRKSYIPPFELNAPLEGHAIGRVIESCDPRFAEGSLVTSMTGWRSHALLEADYLHPIPDMPDIAPEKFLSVLGMPGMTAWVGLNRIANCKTDDTVFVSAAAGAVGSAVCQLAKAKGCHVIGSTGDREKAKWLRTELKVDAVINYRDTDDLSGSLGEVAPQGIDVYYENVGGAHLEAALDHINTGGRIAVCGMISHYNDKSPQPGPRNLFRLTTQRAKMEGFIVSDHWGSYPDFVREGADLVRSGQLKSRETVIMGLENAAKAFIDLFKGQNTGKMLVKLAD